MTIGGSVDAYYRFNFDNAKDGKHTNNLTSFTNSQNSFELGMASVKADYTVGKVEAVADLGFGRRAQEFSYNDQGALTAIKQAYLSYAPSEHIKFTMGKWATHVGYELLDAYLNRNYSMDYMFSYGPFFHTGIKADVTVNSQFGFMVGVANPTDNTTASFARKYAIAQVHLASASGKVTGYLNYVGGKDQTDGVGNQFDLVVTGTVSDQFSLGYNGTVKSYKPSGGSSNAWWGSAVYLNYDPAKVFGLTLRGEYFGDDKGVAGVNTNVLDLTLSGNIRLDNLTIIPEFRLDSAKDPIFYKHGDITTPSAKGTGTFILAATYHF
ncbi:MAG TPA: outer membrane beta-barrel protein [Chitinophagaceae bacterium]|nr:outer membrane beta-barrel protein [Chitinophagaceae bacterium]